MNPRPTIIGIGKSRTHNFGGIERDLLDEEINRLWKPAVIYVEEKVLTFPQLTTATQGFDLQRNLPTTIEFRTVPIFQNFNPYVWSAICSQLESEIPRFTKFIEDHIGVKVSAYMHTQQSSANMREVFLISSQVEYADALRFVTDELIKGHDLGIL